MDFLLAPSPPAPPLSPPWVQSFCYCFVFLVSSPGRIWRSAVQPFPFVVLVQRLNPFGTLDLKLCGKKFILKCIEKYFSVPKIASPEARKKIIGKRPFLGTILLLLFLFLSFLKSSPGRIWGSAVQPFSLVVLVQRLNPFGTLDLKLCGKKIILKCIEKYFSVPKIASPEARTKKS